jgi:hypothetical protein
MEINKDCKEERSTTKKTKKKCTDFSNRKSNNSKKYEQGLLGFCHLAFWTMQQLVKQVFQILKSNGNGISARVSNFFFSFFSFFFFFPLYAGNCQGPGPKCSEEANQCRAV